MPVVALDNTKIGSVGEYIKDNTYEKAKITISSPIFTMGLTVVDIGK